jgi:uncharacterized protein YbaA (DUF1428 family)
MLQSFPMYAYIPAQDVARARRFYEQKVGLKPKQEVAGGMDPKNMPFDAQRMFWGGFRTLVEL